MVDESFAFYDNAPYLVPGTNEQPLRGQFPAVWTSGLTPATGLSELDSIDIRYNTFHTYGGSTVASAIGRIPVKISTVAGVVSGDSGVYPGVSKTWRIIPDWDTTGYRFQWYVNDSVIVGQTGATLSKSFSGAGVSTLRVDQILPDSTVLSSTRVVSIISGAILGPTSVQPDASCQWQADTPSGGVSPYSFSWTVNGGSQSTGEFLDFTVAGQSSLQIQLTITDSAGRSVVVSRSVTVSSGAPMCLS